MHSRTIQEILSLSHQGEIHQIRYFHIVKISVWYTVSQIIIVDIFSKMDMSAINRKNCENSNCSTKYKIIDYLKTIRS